METSDRARAMILTRWETLTGKPAVLAAAA